jgi:hypothetical protein
MIEAAQLTPALPDSRGDSLNSQNEKAEKNLCSKEEV